MTGIPDDITAALVADRRLRPEFEAICDCGGRLTGTPSEAAAQALLRRLGEAASGRPPTIVETPYDGWTCRHASLDLIGAEGPVPLTAMPLLRSAPTPPGGLEAAVLPKPSRSRSISTTGMPARAVT